MLKQRRFRFIPLVFGAVLLFMLVLAMQVTVNAAPQHGFGRDPGRRIAPININDHHTSQWDRFHQNYHFTSGMDYRFDLGRPTTFDSFVPVDVFSVNVRRDANVSLRPPSYGVFSGYVATDPSNRLFPQPVNPRFHQPNQLESSVVNPRFDTLQMGANADPIGNPMNMFNVGEPGALPSTSIGGGNIVPAGANNMTSNWFESDGTIFNQSGNASSTVTAPSAGGFMPPTTVRPTQYLWANELAPFE